MQKEVAEQIGISRGHYIDYEVGYVDYYPKEVVDRLEAFYHIPVEDILDEYNLFLYIRGNAKRMSGKNGIKEETFCENAAYGSQILTGTRNQIKFDVIIYGRNA